VVVVETKPERVREIKVQCIGLLGDVAAVKGELWLLRCEHIGGEELKMKLGAPNFHMLGFYTRNK